MTRRELARLADLAALVFDAEQAKLRASSAAIAEVSRAADAVHEARHERAAAIGAAVEADAATLASADERWHDWGDARLRALQLRRAGLEVERQEHLAETRRAFGRCRAVDAMAREAAEARRARTARRAEEG